MTLAKPDEGVRPGELVGTDLEAWRTHRALTLVHWYPRFQRRRSDIAAHRASAFAGGESFILPPAAAFDGRDAVSAQLRLRHPTEAAPVSASRLGVAPQQHVPLRRLKVN